MNNRNHKLAILRATQKNRTAVTPQSCFFYRDTIVSRQLDYFKRLSHFLLSQVPNVWNSCTSRIRSTTATSITRYL